VKSAREELWFETPHRRDYINITDRVQDFVSRSGIVEGLCLVNPMHITAAVYVNDDESGLIQDIDDFSSGSRRTSPSPPIATTSARTTPMLTSSAS